MRGQPRFPVGKEYENFVLHVACYGLGLGTALVRPSLAASTVLTWRRRAKRGAAPYEAWWLQFLTDLRAQRERLPEWRRV